MKINYAPEEQELQKTKFYWKSGCMVALLFLLLVQFLLLASNGIIFFTNGYKQFHPKDQHVFSSVLSLESSLTLAFWASVLHENRIWLLVSRSSYWGGKGETKLFSFFFINISCQGRIYLLELFTSAFVSLRLFILFIRHSFN